MIRNRTNSSNVDVELFLKVPAHFITKLKRMEMRDSTDAVINTMLPELENCKRQWESS